MNKNFTLMERFKLAMAKKLLYAKRHLSLRNVPDKTNGGFLKDSDTGEIIQMPNYGDGLQKKIVDEVFTKMAELGYTRTECIEIWDKETGVGLVHGRKFCYGILKGMQIWELDHFLKTFNYKLEITHKGHERFSHSIERGRLILSCNRHPKFYLNMNTDNFLDFEVEFQNKFEAFKLTKTRLNTIFRQMLTYYFLTKAKNKKMPFKYPEARVKFESKCIDIREKIDQL